MQTKGVVHKQKNKTPHQNITHDPYNTYTMQYQKEKEKANKNHVIIYAKQIP